MRAFVRTDDHRADELRGLGAEVVVGDLREISSVRPAVRGVSRAFFTYPVTAGLLDATGAFAAAAREEGLTRVVEVSQLDASPDALTPRMRRHWVAEQVFDRAGVGAVHLRAAVFFENLAVVAAAAGDRRELALPLGSGDTLIPLVAAGDVARVAAGLLLDPGPADPVCLVTGQMASIGEAADAMGAEVRRSADRAEWEARAMEIYRRSVRRGAPDPPVGDLPPHRRRPPPALRGHREHRTHRRTAADDAGGVLQDRADGGDPASSS